MSAPTTPASANPAAGQTTASNASADETTMMVESSNNILITKEEFMKTQENLPPYDFRGYTAKFYLSKFTWASYGMPAFLQALAFAAQKRSSPAPAPAQRRNTYTQATQEEDRVIIKGRQSTNKPANDNTFSKNLKQPPPVSTGNSSQQQIPYRRHSTGTIHQQDKKVSAAAASAKKRHSQSITPTNKKPSSQQHHHSQLPYPPQYKGGFSPPFAATPAAAAKPPPYYRPLYSSIPSAAAKPMRRLAKIRPYANQAIPVSSQEIFAAIPREASSYFHIMDRRVNLDAFAHNNTDKRSDFAAIPVYSLLRAWVQDDPCRQVPKHQVLDDWHLPLTTTTTTTTIGSRKRVHEEIIVASTKKDDEESTAKKKKVTLDITGYIAASNNAAASDTTLSLDVLKAQMVQDAKETRKKKAAPKKEDLAGMLEQLRQR